MFRTAEHAHPLSLPLACPNASTMPLEWFFRGQTSESLYMSAKIGWLDRWIKNLVARAFHQGIGWQAVVENFAGRFDAGYRQFAFIQQPELDQN